MMQEAFCPVCSSPYTTTVAAKSVNTVMFCVRQCCNVECLHGFTDPVPSLELLSSLYAADELNAYMMDEDFIENVQKFHSHLLENYIAPLFQQPGSLLDIGAGIGTWVSVATEAGWKATGIEYNQRSVETAKHRFGVELIQGDFYKLANLFSQDFNLITLHHVLEHIRYPSSFVEYLSNFLKPNGCILINVPNILSDEFMQQRALWSFIHIPGHISYFSRFSLDTICLRCMAEKRKFDRVFRSTFPAEGKREGEGLVVIYRMK